MADTASLEQALLANYIIEREIGSGGMARVYLARDVKHHRQVAIKVMRPELATTLLAERFLREITIAASLQHPHILPLYDSGQSEGWLYYVMPYVDGQSLRARLLRERQLSTAAAIRILRDVADALAYAHVRGIVHRDIKPENILLDSRHALVADFGVAKALSAAAGGDRLTTAGVALGTPAYMAPEQALADARADHRIDIYAFGAVAYEILSGRPLFGDVGPQQLVVAQVMTTPEPLTAHRPDVPAGLAAVVMACLEKDPADRPQRAEEILSVLEDRSSAPRSSAASLFRGSSRIRRWTHGKRFMMVGLTALAIVATVIGASVGHRADPNRRLIVVAPFVNETNDPALNDLGDLATNWVADAITRDGAAEAVPPSSVHALLQEKHLGSERALALAKLTGARTVLVGDYRRHGDSVEIRGTLLDASGKILRTIDPVAGVDGSAALLTTLELHVLAIVRAEFEETFTDPRNYSRASNLEAYRAYVTGLEHFYRREHRTAAEYISRAISLDTAWATPLFFLAASYFNMGDLARADSVIRAATPRMHTLAPGDRDLLENLDGRLSGDLAQEYRSARRGFERSPRSFAYPLATTALRVGRAREALNAARYRDTTTSWGREWFYWYLVEGGAYHLLGRYDDELRVARERRARDPVGYDALDLELGARAAMGQLEEVSRLIDNAAAKPLGWDSGPGRAYGEFLAHGHGDAASAMLARCVRTYEANARAAHATRADSSAYASALLWSRDYQRAREVWLRLATSATDDWEARTHAVYALAGLGKRDEAIRASDDWTKSPPPYCPGCAPYARAVVAALVGDRSRAVDLLRQAFSEGRPFSQSQHRTWASLGMLGDPRVRQMLMASRD